MPIYTFKHPDKDEITEVVQRMSEEHVYVDDDGVEWDRVWESPNAAVSTDYANMTSKQFVDATRDKKGKMGDLWDASKEASDKRTKRMGKDPLKDKYFKNYSKSRKGLKHSSDNSRGIKIDGNSL